MIGEEIAAACEGRPGEIDPTASIERDLTGDGQGDPIVSHEGITCAGSGPSRSGFCDIQLCAVNIYVRRGDTLALTKEMLGMHMRVGNGATPALRLYGQGGRENTLRWDGQAFR